MPIRSRYARGLLLTLAGVLAITPDTLLIRLIAADPWTMVFWRGLGLALGIAVIIAVVEGRAGLRNIFRLGRRRMLAAGLLTVTNFGFIWALSLTAVANVLVVVAGAPLVAALLGRVILGEPAALRTRVAALAVAGGVAIIFADDLEGGRFAGNLCAAAATVGFATYLVMLRSVRGTSTLPIPIWGNLVAALLALPLAAPFSLSTEGALWMLLLAGLVLPVAIGLISVGPRYLPAAEVGLLILLETVLGSFWVWLGVGEAPTPGVLAAGAIIILALAANSALGLRSSSRQERTP